MKQICSFSNRCCVLFWGLLLFFFALVCFCFVWIFKWIPMPGLIKQALKMQRDKATRTANRWGCCMSTSKAPRIPTDPSAFSGGQKNRAEQCLEWEGAKPRRPQPSVGSRRNEWCLDKTQSKEGCRPNRKNFEGRMYGASSTYAGKCLLVCLLGFFLCVEVRLSHEMEKHTEKFLIILK